MPGTLKLISGDIFDQPSDLVVIPFTIAGALTRHAQKRLAEYRIPRPPGQLELGAVTTLPFHGAEDIAQYVAYVATAGAATPSGCVEAIAKQLGSETTRNRIISRVAAPLIGVGAGERPGQLESALQATRHGFLTTAAPHAVLALHIADSNLFSDASRWFKDQSCPPEAVVKQSMPIRVFISYTKTSEEHTSWVESLARMLRENGIDARLDAWHLRAGMDLSLCPTRSSLQIAS